MRYNLDVKEARLGENLTPEALSELLDNLAERFYDRDVEPEDIVVMEVIE